MLVVQGLTYEVEAKVLFKDLSFSVKSKESLLLTGPSGSGKSTILKIIARLIAPPSTGTVWLNDQNINNLPIATYRQRVSYATQSAQLFGKTVADNLNLPFKIRNQPLDLAKQKEGLGLMALPPEYLQKPINELSGGEKQRVGLLRNLLFPPEVLLLDEISTGLDSLTKTKIWAVIQQLQEQYRFSLISVTHDESEIANAHHVIQIGGKN